MAELKTKPNKKSVKKFLASVEHKQRREDVQELLPLFEKLTGETAVMWGDSIVGFGSYEYINTQGKSSWPITGFSPRKQNLTIYVMLGFKRYEKHMKKLGKYKNSVSCLYINKLSDVDMKVLEALLKESIRDMRDTYPS